MNNLTAELVLCESRTARDEKLLRMTPENAEIALNKAKALVFLVWKGEGIATTEQIAEYYEVPVNTVQTAIKNHRDELTLDGLRKLDAKSVKALRGEALSKIDIAQNATSLTVWTPRATLRLSMFLRDSQVARQVRTLVVDIVEAVPTAVLEAVLVVPCLPEAITEYRVVADLIDETLAMVGIDIGIRAQHKLGLFARKFPQIAAEVEETKLLIGGTQSTEDHYISPTDIGKRFKPPINARKVNQLLADAGLQAKGERDWELTEEGKKYGKVFLATGANNRWSGGQIRWLPSVVNVINR